MQTTKEEEEKVVVSGIASLSRKPNKFLANLSHPLGGPRAHTQSQPLEHSAEPSSSSAGEDSPMFTTRDSFDSANRISFFGTREHSSSLLRCLVFTPRGSQRLAASQRADASPTRTGKKVNSLRPTQNACEARRTQLAHLSPILRAQITKMPSTRAFPESTRTNRRASLKVLDRFLLDFFLFSDAAADSVLEMQSEEVRMDSSPSVEQLRQRGCTGRKPAPERSGPESRLQWRQIVRRT